MCVSKKMLQLGPVCVVPSDTHLLYNPRKSHTRDAGLLAVNLLRHCIVNENARVELVLLEHLPQLVGGIVPRVAEVSPGDPLGIRREHCVGVVELPHTGLDPGRRRVRRLLASVAMRLFPRRPAPVPPHLLDVVERRPEPALYGHIAHLRVRAQHIADNRPALERPTRLFVQLGKVR